MVLSILQCPGQPPQQRATRPRHPAQEAGLSLDLFFFFFNFCLHWVFVVVYVGFLSSCSKTGVTLHCGMQASHCGGFSRGRAQALEHADFVGPVVAAPVAPWHVESSPMRDQTYVPCIGRWILKPWTSRDVHVIESCLARCKSVRSHEQKRGKKTSGNGPGAVLSLSPHIYPLRLGLFFPFFRRGN